MVSDAVFIMKCCHALNLDLVCIPAKDSVGDNPDLAIGLTDVRWFADQDIFVFWIVNGSFQTAMERWGLIKLLKEIAVAPNNVAKKLLLLSVISGKEIAVNHLK